MSGKDTIASTVTLRGGISAPRYVFGTGNITTPEPIHHALSVGYRAFDTAQQYENEALVGEAIRTYPDYQSGQLKREDVFIISKVNVPGKSVDETLKGIEESVKKIGLGSFVDLFLVHNPNHGPNGRKIEWQALEEAKSKGLVKAIGVSNYTVKHLEDLKTYAKETPAVNQTELSAFHQDKDVEAWCKKEGVQLQAFAPVTRGKKSEDPALLKIAGQVGQSWNRVMLRYAFQKGWIVTCKSQTPSRITDNASIFEFSLSPEQMKELDGLECGFKVTPSTIKDDAERGRYYLDMP